MASLVRKFVIYKYDSCTVETDPRNNSDNNMTRPSLKRDNISFTDTQISLSVIVE